MKILSCLLWPLSPTQSSWKKNTRHTHTPHLIQYNKDPIQSVYQHFRCGPTSTTNKAFHGIPTSSPDTTQGYTHKPIGGTQGHSKKTTTKYFWWEFVWKNSMWILNNAYCGNIDFSVCVQKVVQEKHSM